MYSKAIEQALIGHLRELIQSLRSLNARMTGSLKAATSLHPGLERNVGITGVNCS
jgi:hypothetical protein